MSNPFWKSSTKRNSEFDSRRMRRSGKSGGKTLRIRASFWLPELPAVFFFAVRGELLARRNFLRKYDGVTFLHDGLLLDGDKPKRIPREKIHQVTFSTVYENKEEILIADFYLKSLLNTACFAFQLRSDEFTEPERFASSCRLWHRTVFDREENHGSGT